MAFGWPTRYLVLDPQKAKGGIESLKWSLGNVFCTYRTKNYLGGPSGWDAGVSKASDIYGGRMHNLCCDNCHSHVATALDIMEYGGSSNWNMVSIAARMLFCGRFVRYAQLSHWKMRSNLFLVIISIFPVFQFWWFSEDVVAIFANECHHRAHYCLIHSWFIVYKYCMWLYRANVQCSCDTSSIDA